MFNYDPLYLDKGLIAPKIIFLNLSELIFMREKKYSDEVEKEKKLFSDNDKELSLEMKKTLSRTRAVIRIIVGFFALLVWILIGVSPTILFSSGMQGFIGTVSFFIRNPIIFLLIAFFNIILGVIEYFFFGILWWAAFHFIWSIRWFYGFSKYRKIKKYPDKK
jgi:hypothetical protein